MSYSVTSNFAGIEASGYLSAALFEGETLANEDLTILPSVKYKINLPKVDFGTLLQSDGCDWNSSGNLIKNEVQIQPVKFKVNFQGCKTDFEVAFESTRMRAGAKNSDAPADLQTYITDLMGKKVSEEVEYSIWRSSFSGTTGYTLNSMTGVYQALSTAAGIIRQTGTTLTAANIVAELTKVYNLIPNQVLDKAKIYVSKATAKLYKIAQATVATANGTYFIGDRPLDFLGVPILARPGCADNYMAAFASDTVYFATDLTSDLNEVALIDMSTTDGSDNVRYKMRASGQVGVSYGAFCVFYHQ